MLALWLISIITFVLGFFVGQKKVTSAVIQKSVEQIKKKIDDYKVGAIERPSAYIVNKRADKEKAEEEQAVIDVLKDIPELNSKV